MPSVRYQTETNLPRGEILKLLVLHVFEMALQNPEKSNQIVQPNAYLNIVQANLQISHDKGLQKYERICNRIKSFILCNSRKLDKNVHNFTGPELHIKNYLYSSFKNKI